MKKENKKAKEEEIPKQLRKERYERSKRIIRKTRLMEDKIT